ncbi:MAG: hypothetical protein HY698_18335 [Deltaproteobacteria bacterium]|nr:hypothetical protein [Deltaproteobacteria bacterium]
MNRLKHDPPRLACPCISSPGLLISILPRLRSSARLSTLAPVFDPTGAVGYDLPSMSNRLFPLGVSLASFSTIALQLMLTRIYSVTMYYHFAFMVISLALLGLAISGVAIYLFPGLLATSQPSHPGRPGPGRTAGAFMWLFSLTSLWALHAAVSSPISLKGWQDNIGKLLALYFAASLPFLCSGFAISIAIASAKEKIGKIYAFDLVGAALGCVFVIPALSRLGGPGAILCNAAVGAVSAVLLTLSDQNGKKGKGLILPGVAAASALALLCLALLEPSARRFGIARNPDKFLGKREVLLEKWNAFSQVTVAPAGDKDHRWIFIDADAATRMWSGEIKEAGYQATRRIPEVRVASLVYSIRNQGTALIIGPGGGTDVISALFHGVTRVVGVEVNPIIVRSIMGERFAEYSGQLYRDPRVHVVVDEGRSYIRRSGELYASIQATLVDTWAASSSGAFTLSENNLYTVEAFQEFLGHLAKGGILTVTRWYDASSPREFLRLLALGRAALEARGVAPHDVERHFVLATDGERRGTVLLNRDPFTPEEIQALAKKASEDRLRILFSPYQHSPDEDQFLAAFVRAPSAATFLGELPYDASPTTDEKPFFFYNLRPRDLASLPTKIGHLELNNVGVAILLFLLAVSTAMTVLFVLLPLFLFRRDALQEERRSKLRVLAYFLCLGFGYILVEIGFMQQFVLFLGHPIYALAVVLATLLLASGLGSAISGWGARKYGTRGYVTRAVLALVVVLLLYAVSLRPLFHAMMGLVLPARIAVAAVLVLIPGLLMGALLPSGVRTANALGADLVPWAWGLNGATSVVGSILAVTLSMNFGFTVALGAGIAAYAIAMVSLPDTPSQRTA